jgi:hypothetical protein
VPLSEHILVICELCNERIPTSRRNAKQDRLDHAEDAHHDVFFAIPVADRANYLHRCFRITSRLGKPEPLD